MTDIRDKPDSALAGLLCSRLCHDLISPIGAISNGLELLELSGGVPGEELSLIRDSVEAASARIRFFRLAFGAASSDQQVAAREIHGTLDALYGQGRIAVHWLSDSDHPRPNVQRAFLAIACLEHAMAWGGQIEVRAAQDAWVLHAQAERLKINDDLWMALSKGTPPTQISGAEVQFALLSTLCQELRRPISVTKGAQSLSLLL